MLCKTIQPPSVLLSDHCAEISRSILRSIVIVNCPQCTSQRIHQSRRRGNVERILAMLFVRPFRCERCDSRFFRWSMTFNIRTTQRVSCFCQYDQIDDLIACKLRSNKCPILRQFLVDEFHFSAVLKCLDPLFVWHCLTSSTQLSFPSGTIAQVP